jgi:hypothetical protein
MGTAGGVAQPVAGRIDALLVLRHAIENKDFLTTAMAVVIETAARGLAHDRGGPYHLPALAIELAPLHAGHRRWAPGDGAGVCHHGLGQVGMQVHAGILINHQVP